MPENDNSGQGPRGARVEDLTGLVCFNPSAKTERIVEAYQASIH